MDDQMMATRVARVRTAMIGLHAAVLAMEEPARNRGMIRASQRASRAAAALSMELDGLLAHLPEPDAAARAALATLSRVLTTTASSRQKADMVGELLRRFQVESQLGAEIRGKPSV